MYIGEIGLYDRKQNTWYNNFFLRKEFILCHAINQGLMKELAAIFSFKS